MRNIEAFHVLQTVFVKVCIPPIAIWARFGAITSSIGVGKGRGGGLPLLEKSCGFTGLMQVCDTLASSLLASRP